MQPVIAVVTLCFTLACSVFVPLAAAEQLSRQADWQKFLESYQAHFSAIKGKSGERGSKLSDTGRQSFVNTATALYRQNPRDIVAYDAILFVLSEGRQHRHREEICRNLRTYHIRNSTLNLALSVSFPLTVFGDECEQLFNEAIVSGATGKVRDTARLRLSVIYQRMMSLLANTAELRMTLQAYITSEVRSSFSRLPEKTVESIGRQFGGRKWLNRRWQAVWSQALHLAKAVQQSPHQLEYYGYSEGGFRQVVEGSVGDMASKIYFQLNKAAPGVKIADFKARDLEGNPVSFAQYQGKVIVLDIWATWCEPCVKGLSYMRTLQQSMRGRPFQLITLSLDRKPQDVKNFMRRSTMPFVNWYIGEDQDFFSKWPVWPIPKLYVIDEKGVIRSTPRVGHQDLARYLDRLVTNAERTSGR